MAQLRGMENLFENVWEWKYAPGSEPCYYNLPRPFELNVLIALDQIQRGFFAKDMPRGGEWYKGSYADPYLNERERDAIREGRIFSPFRPKTSQ